MLERIKMVTEFAEDERSAFNEAWTSVFFKDGSVFALNHSGMVIESLDEDIGAFSVGAAALLKAFKAVPDADKLKVKDSHLVLSGHKSRAKVRFKDQLITPPTDIPRDLDWKTVEGFEVKSVAWASPTEKQYDSSSGICLSNLGAEATDKKVYALRRICRFEELLGERVIVPVNMLLGLPATVDMAISGNRLFVSADPERKSFRAINLKSNQFVDLEALLKEELSKPKMLVDAFRMKSLLKSAQQASPEVQLECSEDKVAVTVAEDSQVALFGFSGDIPAENGQEVSAFFDVGNLIKAFSSVEGAVNISISSSLSPLFIEQNDYVTIVLPLRA